jgi:NAD-dependent dihydropyrimidine dehydrogenase PreA subunit
VPHVDIEWGLTLDAEACTGGGVCIDFCHHDVYRWATDENKVMVARKLHCVPGRSHCGTLCDAQAISFLTLEGINRAHRCVRPRATATSSPWAA